MRRLENFIKQKITSFTRCCDAHAKLPIFSSSVGWVVRLFYPRIHIYFLCRIFQLDMLFLLVATASSMSLCTAFLLPSILPICTKRTFRHWLQFRPKCMHWRMCYWAALDYNFHGKYIWIDLAEKHKTKYLCKCHFFRLKLRKGCLWSRELQLTITFSDCCIHMGG